MQEFWFCFSLVEKTAQVLLNQSQSVVKQNQSKREITFDTQLKTTLCSYIVVEWSSFTSNTIYIDTQKLKVLLQ